MKKVDKSKSTYVLLFVNVKNNSVSQEYENDINISTMYKIYIQCIKMTITLLKDIMKFVDEQNVEGYDYNKDIEIKQSIHNKMDAIDSILNEFTRLFSITQDTELENIHLSQYLNT